MIIYKTQESGQATDFQYRRDNYKLKDNEKSIKGDRIPEDITPYHEQKYIDSELLGSQKSTCLRLLKETDHTQTVDYSNRYSIEDQQKYAEYRSKLMDILKSSEIQTIPEKPFS